MSLPHITGEFGIGSIEAKFSQSGKLWVRMRLVAKDAKRDANTGQWVDGDPCWLTAVAWGSIAENLAESVEKGDQIVVTGRLAMSEWTTESGEKRTDYQINVESAGTGLRWNPARPVKGERNTAAATQGAAQVPTQQSTDAPF